MTSLGEEIAKLSNPVPLIFDPEDDEDADILNVASSDKQDTFEKSELRSRTAPLLEDVDPAYIGRKTSRSSRGLVFEKGEDLDINSEEEYDSKSMTSDDVTDEEDGQLNQDDISIFKKKLLDKSTSDVEEDEESSSESDEDEELEKDNIISQFQKIDVTSEVEKGNAIKSQEEIWSKLCEARIKLQKLLLLANKLPQTESWQVIKKKVGEEMSQLVHKDNDSLKLLLNSLINLQCELSERNTKVDESVDEMDIPSDSENETDAKEVVQEANDEQGTNRKRKNEAYNDILSKRFKSEKPYRNSVIQKWDEKVRLSTGRITQKSFNAFNNSAVKQIDQVLQDKNRLIKRTQLKRSAFRVLGKPEFDIPKDDEANQQEFISKQDMLLKDYDSQIFDDDDFYRQLLKDIIQSKSSGLDPSIIRKQMELQKIRNKMKRKVDTKASKGRKLRYDVHPKLVNFMAPVQKTTISDAARENMLKHLFGKNPIP